MGGVCPTPDTTVSVLGHGGAEAAVPHPQNPKAEGSAHS